MKNLLTILIIAFSIFGLSAQYSVSTNGTNSQNSKNFRTISYAASQVSSGTIFINEGTYNETSQINLKEGVNLDGAGKDKVVINSQLSGYLINLISGNGSNGNQFIRNITLNGVNLAGKAAIMVKYRSNVSIYDVIIKDFLGIGVYFYGSENSYDIGNKLYDSQILNCSDRQTGESSMVMMHWNKKAEIYNNIFNQTQRSPGHNGNILTVQKTSHVEDIKIHDNKFFKPNDEGGEWNFSIEGWPSGGWEIYNNEFWGGGQQIDIGGENSIKGIYPYSIYIHHNKFAMDKQKETDANKGSEGIDIERGETVIIENNHFLNLGMGIELNSNGLPLVNYPGIGIKNVTIRNNIFENLGYSVRGWSPVIFMIGDNSNKQQDIYIYNNVITNSGATGKPIMGVFFANAGDIVNCQVKDNIFTDIVERGYTSFWGGNVLNSFSRNNLIYNCANSNKPYKFSTNGTINYTESGNINLKPVFKADFTLQDNSPGKSLNIGIIKNSNDSVIIPPTPAPETITFKIPYKLTIGTKEINGTVNCIYNLKTKEILYE